jgi:hypothetical protein
MITFQPSKIDSTKPIELTKPTKRILIIPTIYADDRFKSLGHGLSWVYLDEVVKQDIK